VSQPKFYLELETIEGIDASDDGRFYSYSTIICEGDTVDELLDSGSTFLVDQDGGEGPERLIGELPTYLYNQVVEAVIEAYRTKGGAK
jgi:hypothetical protein